jgi:hypothetical protein
MNWEATKEEHLLIQHVVDRGYNELHRAGFYKNRLTMHMDLEAAHCNGCKLDFKKLLAFKDFDFYHDTAGIAAHIDRNTGMLKECFLPRCSR